MALRTAIVICPGVHLPQLTEAFLAELQASLGASGLHYWVYPAHDLPAYSSLHLLGFLHNRLQFNPAQSFSSLPLVFVSFSAGVVAAIGAAIAWQQGGGQVRSLIALDGWGVPLGGSFPIHRCSHDAFTHWSSALLGGGAESFYADPGVEHLELWRSPQTAFGWQTSTNAPLRRTTAIEFLAALIRRYSTPPA
ncbi:MAG TPA: hypothetical protein V6D18_05825 [Thermosynechococcaceae cyanobacterium]